MIGRPYVKFALAMLIAACGTLPAQDLTFSYRTSASPATIDVDINGQIILPATPVGTSTSATLIITNRGQVTYTLATLATTTQGFKANTVGEVSLPQGGAGAITILFSPTLRGTYSDTLTMVFTKSNGGQQVRTLFLSGLGKAADILTSYLLPGGNQTAVANGQAITFPPTIVGQANTATFIVSNSGNADSVLRAVTASGVGFTIAGLPLLPATVEPGRDVRFTVQFKPETLGAAQGSLRLELSDGNRIFTLQGSGVGASLSYSVNTDGNFVRIAPGAVIRMPGTPVAGRRVATIRVVNEGTVEGRVTVVSVSGAAYRLQDVVPLPATVPPQGVFSFAVVFTPATSGPAEGRLFINETSFDILGEGIGPRLTFATEVGGSITPVPDSNLIILPNTTAGSRLASTVIVKNEGNAPATLSSVSVSGAPFEISNLPQLPVTVAEGQTVLFTVTFLPTAVGTFTGGLQIDERSFSIRASAGNPPPLPEVRIENLSETAESLQQPSVGLTIADTYPVDVTGRINLGFTAESFGDDPSVQFASGGRTAEFRIPANTREAIFGESAKTIQFQTGTVAGVISIGATFSVGSANITPNPAPAKTVLVASQPPRIRSVQIGTRSTNSFEVLITGYSPTRALNNLILQFAPVPGSNLATTSLTVNADSAFSAWYQGATSRQFGSQFTASLTINVTGDVNTVQSVSVSGTNSKGTSNSMSVNLR
ncbi:MAG: choice-of-anchor D domain-containing protein [Bryobacterales bacterium]|nr:choice-of-anchor D domain-containing protein [Bryobacterales bacterium]